MDKLIPLLYPLLFLSLWLVGCNRPPVTSTPTADQSVTPTAPADLPTSPAAVQTAISTPAAAASATAVTGPSTSSGAGLTTTLELEDTLILYAALQEQNWALEAYPGRPAFGEKPFDAFYGPEARMEDVRRYTQFNFGPQLSPNGRYLLLPGVGGYDGPDNSGLWFVNLLTGETRQLLPRAKAFTWSPYGDQITYVDGNALFTLSVAEGAEPQPLFSHPNLWDLYARWSPDGSTVATMSAVQGEPDETGYPALTDTYWLVDTTSGQATELAIRPGAAMEHVDEEMSWSPTGRYLLVRGELFTQDGELLPTEFPNGGHWLPVPEALQEGEQEKLLVNDQDGLRIVTIDGQEVTRLSSQPVYPWSFSHNGRFLAYRDPQTGTGILVHDLQDDETVQLDPGLLQVGALHWNGNDEYLLLDDGGRSGAIWAVAIQPGSQPQMLLESGVLIDALPAPAQEVAPAAAVAIPTTNPADLTSAAPSSAPGPVVFFARDDDLWRANLNGEQAEPLTAGGPLAWGMAENADDWGVTALSAPPRVSPDGRWIAFSPDGRSLSLLDMRAPGQLRRIEPGALIPAWSPDSGYLAYGTDDKLLIYDVENDRMHTVTAGTEGIANVVWSPTMQHIAYACCFERTEPYSPANFGEVRRIEIASGEVESIDAAISTIGGGTSPLCWTDDGQVVKRRDMTPGDVVPCSYDRLAAMHAFNGGQIASFAPASPEDDFWEGNSLLTVSQAETDEILWQREVNGRAHDPRWALDGTSIIFQSDDAQENSLSIWRIAADGTADAEQIINDAYLLDVIPQWANR